MEKSKFSIGAAIAIVVLLIYTYIAFLGLVYWQEGNVVLPIVLSFVFVVFVITCIILMCLAKASRWQRMGIIGQTLFGFLVFCTFVLSAFPFTNFLRVIGKQGKITSEINTLLTTAQNLDQEYNNYSENRLRSYAENLRLISSAKEVQPTEYERCLGGANGEDDETKIANLQKSLRRQLLPDSISEIQREHQKWLKSAGNMSVWNVLLPANIAEINKAVDHWTINYETLSQIIYAGEEAEPFEYEHFDSNLERLAEDYAHLHKPSLLAIFVSIFCFFVMLLPYWLTEKSLAGKRISKNLYE